MTPKSTPKFDITPEKEASKLSVLHRQLFVTPPPSTANLQGKTALVVGSNIGIGLECCRQLLELGLDTLILGVRTEAKGVAARDDLLKSLSVKKRDARPTVEIWTVDLLSYKSTVALAERCKTLPIDIVVLNAGIVKPTFSRSPETGHEETVQVNYLSTALLTLLLIPVLRKPARVTIVNSDTSAWAKFKERQEKPMLPSFDEEKNYDLDRYYTTKLLGQLFLVELAKRVPSSMVTINATNPGLCKGTGLHRNLSGPLSAVMSMAKSAIGRTLEVGARCLTDAAVNYGEEAHGQYFGDGKMKPMAPFVYSAQGEEIAKQLWQETMAELSFAKVEEILSGLSG